jgi:hypothetical protein
MHVLALLICFLRMHAYSVLRSSSYGSHVICLCKQMFELFSCTEFGDQFVFDMIRDVACSFKHCSPRLSQHDCCLPFSCIHAQTMQHCQHPHIALNLSLVTWIGQQSATLCLWYPCMQTANAPIVEWCLDPRLWGTIMVRLYLWYACLYVPKVAF